MARPADRAHELEKQRKELKAKLVATGDLRQGSLVKRYRTCGKPGCHCAQAGADGHGPTWSLTRAVHGKTVTRVIPPSAVDQTRAQIAEYHRFRTLARELIDVSDALCDARLAAGAVDPHGPAKRGASKAPSRPRSSKKSKPS